MDTHYDETTLPDDSDAPVTRYRALRRRVYEIIEIGHGEDRASKLFDTFIVALILLNISAFVAESVPSIHQPWAQQLYDFDMFSVAVFTIEYLLRLWTAVEVPMLSRMPPWKARLMLARRPELIIDLLSIVPFYLHHFFELDLRVLRALRLLRFLKLSRYSPAMHTLIRVLSNERKALAGAALLLATALLFSATLMYYIEGHVQPEKYGTVPDAAWWAISTLTTVGYGDVTPVTALGRLLGAVTMIVGMCILALPVAIISTGFAQELQRRDFVVNWSLMSRVPMLAELDAKDAAQIMPMLHAHNLPPNVEIIRKGAPGDAIYFVASGKIDQHCEQEQRSYGAGAVFGAATMLENDIHEGHVITAAKTRLLKLHREDFHRIEASHPHIAAHIRRAAAKGKKRRDPPALHGLKT